MLAPQVATRGVVGSEGLGRGGRVSASDRSGQLRDLVDGMRSGELGGGTVHPYGCSEGGLCTEMVVMHSAGARGKCLRIGQGVFLQSLT